MGGLQWQVATIVANLPHKQSQNFMVKYVCMYVCFVHSVKKESDKKKFMVKYGCRKVVFRALVPFRALAQVQFIFAT